MGTHADRADPGLKYQRIIEVQKLCDEAQLEIDVSSRYHEISCYDLTGISELRHAILSVTAKMPHMREKIPTSYKAILETVRRLATSENC